MADLANMDCAGGALQVQEIPIAIQDNMGSHDTALAVWQLLGSSNSFVGLGLAALLMNKRFLGATAAMVTLVFVAKPITVAIIKSKLGKAEVQSREVNHQTTITIITASQD
jgi:hypothetical protein